MVEAADAGHRVSQELVDQAGKDLADTGRADSPATRLEGPVILGSGLGMNVVRLQDSFRSHLAAAGVTDVRVLDREPVFGVLQLVGEGL